MQAEGWVESSVMKKMFSLVAMAAAISFASCTGNKTAQAEEACDSTACQEECGTCPVKAATAALATALEAQNGEDIVKTLKDVVAQAGELAKAGKNEAVDALVQNVTKFLTENEQKLQDLGIIDAIKTFPETVEATVTSAKESVEDAANQTVEDAKAAAAQKVDEATNKAAQKVDEATNKAAEKIDEAAKKASDKIDEAAAKTKEKLGL